MREIAIAADGRTSADVFDGPGEMRRRCRALAWETTAVGAVESWPPCLRTAVQLALAAHFPTLVMWGPSLAWIYNDAYRDALGDAQAVPLGGPADERHADPLALDDTILDRVRAGETVWREHVRGVSPAADARAEGTVTISYAPIREPGGAVGGVFVTMAAAGADASTRAAARTVRRERERADETARASEHRLDVLADLVPDLLWTNDPDGSCQWVNRRWLDYTGQTVERARGFGWLDAVHPDDRAQTLLRFQHALFSGEPLEREHRMRRADGAYRWFLVRANPERDETGRILRWFGAATDVDVQRTSLDAERLARLEAEAARREDTARRRAADEERERLSRVLAQAPFAVALLHGPEHVVVLQNAASRRLFGRRATIGRPLAEGFDAPEIGPLLGSLDEAFSTGQTVVRRGVPLAWTADGDQGSAERYFDLVEQPIRDAEGRVDGVLSVAVDVTPSVVAGRQLETARADAERTRRSLEEAQDSLERRIAVRTAELGRTNRALAQEIAERTRVEAGRNELRQQLASAEEDERRRLSRELHDQLGQHLTAVTLGLAQVRAGVDADSPLQEQVARLQELLTLLTRDVRFMAVELRPPELDDVGLASALSSYIDGWSLRYGVAAEVQLDTSQPLHVPELVATTIYRVAQESLTNVAKHAQARQVSVILEHRAGDTQLIVEDDGRGFDVETTTAHATAEHRLGLAGMRERVELAGGTLEVESAPSGGTTIYARFPAAHPPQRC